MGEPRPTNLMEAKAQIARLVREENDLRERLTDLRRLAKDLYTAETGIGMGTRLMMHEYKRSHFAPKIDQLVQVVQMFTSNSGEPGIRVSIITKDGKLGRRQISLGGRWSKADG